MPPNLDAGIIVRPRVWIMQAKKDAAGNYTFPLAWGSWVECRRLIAKGDVRLPGGMGRAQFDMMRNVFVPDGTNTRTFSWNDALTPIIPGCWICITNSEITLPSSDPRPADVTWFGFIDEVSGEQLQGTTEVMGSVTALEIGHLLDRVIPHGWSQAGFVQDGQGYPAELGTPPPANLAGRFDGEIIGNAVAGVDGKGNNIYLFQPQPAQCGTTSSKLFTRWRLLRHMIQLCTPGALGFFGAAWEILCADGSQVSEDSSDLTKISGYLNDTTTSESFQVAGVTFKGMLDTLLPRSQSIGWYPRFSANADGSRISITIYIYVINDSASFSMPFFGAGGAYATTDIDATADPIVKIDRRTSGDDMPDEIIVEGSNIIFGVSGSKADGNIAQGWASTQQTDYKTAAKLSFGYGSLTAEKKRDRNRSLRQSPALHDVLTRYIVTTEDLGLNTSGIFYYENSGTATGAKLPIFKNVAYDLVTKLTKVGFIADNAGVLTESAKVNIPYIPTATLTRTLPWIDGYTSNGADSRPGHSKPWTTFLKPRLFYYDPSQTAGQQWVNMLAHGGEKRPTPSIDVDDRGPAIRIVFDKPERMGSSIISTTGDDVTDGLYDIEGDPPTAGLNFFDWQKVVITFGMASDQRVKARRLRPGVVNDSDIRRTLTVKDDKLQCWIMLKGSIIGLKSDGTPDRVTAAKSDAVHYVTRSDFGKANRVADRLAAWAFRRRNAVTITRMRPDLLPAWASIGVPIGIITERVADQKTNVAAITLTSSTVVERVERIWGPAPRAIIETNLPSQPDGGSGSSSPAAGGPVSMTLGGTVPQAIERVQAQSIVQQGNSQGVPLIQGTQPGLPAVPVQILVSTANNKLLGYGSLRGAIYSATPLTPAAPLATAYNPLAQVAITDDGIAYGSATINGVSTNVLIVNRPINDASGNPVSYGLLSLDLPETCVFIAYRTVQVPVSGGTYITAYEAYWA